MYMYTNFECSCFVLAYLLLIVTFIWFILPIMVNLTPALDLPEKTIGCKWCHLLCFLFHCMYVWSNICHTLCTLWHYENMRPAFKFNLPTFYFIAQFWKFNYLFFFSFVFIFISSFFNIPVQTKSIHLYK